MNAIEIKRLRKVEETTKRNIVKTENIRKLSKRKPIMRKMKTKQLNWYKNETKEYNKRSN